MPGQSHDWATSLGWLTIALTAVIIVVFAVVELFNPMRNWKGGGTFPFLGAGITLGLAALLSHLANSGIVLLVDLVARYLHGLNPWAPAHRGAQPLLRQSDDAFIYRGSDTLAASWALLVAAVLALGLLMLLFRWLFGSSHDKRARRIHLLVAEPGRYLYPVLAIVAVAGVCTVLWLTLVRMDGVQGTAGEVDLRGWDEAVRTSTVLVMHLLMLFLPFALLNKNIRATVAVISDVVGYWPIAYHPLAAPPYRFHVVDAAVDEIKQLERPVIIVGHSQGSVLAAAVVRRLKAVEGESFDRQDYALVTCGSPLASLYSTYFPAEFPRTKRTATKRSVRAWHNVWRETDPIATRLRLGPTLDHENLDGDERTDGSGKVRAHGDYWIESDQVSIVEGLLPGLE